MTTEQEERLVVAFESIATALLGLNLTDDKRFNKQFPPREEVVDATVTRIPSEEEQLRESLGGTGEQSTEEWIGLREQEFIERGSKA